MQGLLRLTPSATSVCAMFEVKLHVVTSPLCKSALCLGFCLKPRSHSQHNYNKNANTSNGEHLPCLEGYRHAQMDMFAW